MAANAARQQRNEPVRLTSSVSSQISGVISRERRGPQHAGRADESRETARLLDGREKALDLVDLAHVRRHRRGLAPAVADASGDAVEGLAVAGGKHDVGAGRRDGLGGGGSDPAAGARDHRQPSRKPMPRLSHGPRPRHQRRRLAGRAARERRGSARDPDGVRHDRGNPSARVLAVLLTASAAAWMSSGATRKPVTLVDDHLAERAALEGDDRSPARLRFGGDHPERLVPPCRDTGRRPRAPSPPRATIAALPDER